MPLIIKDNEAYAFKITNLRGKDLVIYKDGNVLGLENFFDAADPTVIINRIPILIEKAIQNAKA